MLAVYTRHVVIRPELVMSMPLLSLLQYKSWADTRTLAAVAHIDRSQHGAAFDFARQQLNHMVRVEALFRARLIGEPAPHDSTNTAQLPAFAALAASLEASNHWLLDYVPTLNAGALAQCIRFTFVDGQKGAMSREEMLCHLINHGTYHRGAIGHALDLAGAPRPADTYTVFLHAAEPGRREE